MTYVLSYSPCLKVGWAQMEEVHLGLNIIRPEARASCKSRYHADSSYHPPLLCHNSSPSALVVCWSQSAPAHESSLLNLQECWHHIGSLKLTMVEVFTPEKLANSINQIFFLLFRKLVVKYLPVHYYSDHISYCTRGSLIISWCTRKKPELDAQMAQHDLLV